VGLKNLKFLYRFLISVIYFLFGTLLLLKYLVWQEVPSFSIALFGVVVMAYGFFRGYRAYMAYKIAKDEQDDNK